MRNEDQEVGDVSKGCGNVYMACTCTFDSAMMLTRYHSTTALPFRSLRSTMLTPPIV